MDYLPKDHAILVSSVNMLLRDEEFDTLESLCYAFSREPKEIFCIRSGMSISILPSTGRRMILSMPLRPMQMT